jgi:dienelactone hydrolase
MTSTRCSLLAVLCALVAAVAGCGPLDEPAVSSRPGELLASRCQVTADSILCSKRELPLPALLVSRTVHYELPLGTPPKEGWPVVVYFQGSFFAGSRAFAASRDEAFGAYHLTATVKALLDAGYAVLAPDALIAGSTFWQTNVPPWSLLWTTSSDHALMLSALRAIGDGRFGPLDASRLYAMGISSGGFMTSRMAVSYRGRFRALAVHSASYATCSALCLVPSLPGDHPPTLFLHGGLDLIVPVPSMEVYRDALRRDGVEVRTVLDPAAGHQWLPSGPRELVDWFRAH